MRFATRVLVAGAILESAAVLQQLQWHAEHGGAEPFGGLVAAHAPIYVGAALGAAGALISICQRSRVTSSSLLLVAACARLSALAFDARLHAAGADATLAHDAYRAGVLLASLPLAGAASLRVFRRWIDTPPGERRRPWARLEGRSRSP